MVVSIFRVVVGGGGWWWMVVCGGMVYTSPYKICKKFVFLNLFLHKYQLEC